MTKITQPNKNNRRHQRKKRQRLFLIVLALFCMTIITIPTLLIKNTIEEKAVTVSSELLAQEIPVITKDSPLFKYDAKYLIFINKDYGLNENYVPDDLVTLTSEFATNNTMQLDSTAAEAFKALVSAAKLDGHTIKLVSGYRSYALQKSIFEKNVAKSGRDVAETYSAPPGHSEHQSGLAADVSSPSSDYALVQSYGQTPEGIWLAQNAHRFGFIMRYQEGTQHITGYIYEPWHIRYVGLEPAAEIYQQNITFEEYMGIL